MDGPDPRFAQNRYIPRRVGHRANQCGARSVSPQLILRVRIKLPESLK